MQRTVIPNYYGGQIGTRLFAQENQNGAQMHIYGKKYTIFEL